MPSFVARLRSDLSPMLSLALPVVAAEVGWMAMGVVDTVMVGRVGSASSASRHWGPRSYC